MEPPFSDAALWVQSVNVRGGKPPPGYDNLPTVIVTTGLRLVPGEEGLGKPSENQEVAQLTRGATGAAPVNP